MIPVCEPWFPGKEEQYVAEAMKTKMISGSGGAYIERFEQMFAAFCGMEHAVVCSNGLAALHLACLALGLKEGDEVIMPDFTMIASVNAVIYTGAKPVLVDADPKTYCIDITKIEEKITPRTKAIMPVHIYGHPCDMDPILELAKKYNLFVLEDAAEAHGAEYKGKRMGSFSDISCFSFYANKIITTGEGGMCLTNKKEFADAMRKLRNHGFDVPRFTHSIVGYNYRLPNVQAAIGVAQMENANLLVEARRKVGLMYNEKLAGLQELITLPIEKEFARNVYWMYGIVLKDSVKLSKEAVMKALLDRGIQTRSFFVPVHRQPVFLNQAIPNAPDCSGSYPVSDYIGERGFYLPSSSTLDEATISHIVGELKAVLTSA